MQVSRKDGTASDSNRIRSALRYAGAKTQQDFRQTHQVDRRHDAAHHILSRHIRRKIPDSQW
jgi:hypothetical protein